MRHLTRCVGAGCVGVALAASAANAAAPLYWGGSVYEFVSASTTFEQARVAAASMSYLGLPGRLATITSAAENAFVTSLLPAGNGQYFLGGSDAGVEGTWTWVTGPEAGQAFYRNGAPVGGAYANWRAGEPNAFFPGEDYLVIRSDGTWVDEPDSYLHQGFVVEYRLPDDGFDFAMTTSHAGAVRNISPLARLVRLDIQLAGDTFFDSAATPPGLEFTPWSVVAASPGVAFTPPGNAATDGTQFVSLAMNLGPTDALHFLVDLDRFGNPDGPGLAAGTVVTAHLQLGDIEYAVTGTVGEGEMTVLGTSFPFSVRAVNAVPEPAAWMLFGPGLLFVLGLWRRRSARR